MEWEIYAFLICHSNDRSWSTGKRNVISLVFISVNFIICLLRSRKASRTETCNYRFFLSLVWSIPSIFPFSFYHSSSTRCCSFRSFRDGELWALLKTVIFQHQQIKMLFHGITFKGTKFLSRLRWVSENLLLDVDSFWGEVALSKYKAID